MFLTTTLTALSLALAVDSLPPPLKADVNERLSARGTTGCPHILPLGGSIPSQDYYNGAPDGCPIKNTMDAAGNCVDALKATTDDECSAYCEVKNKFFHGAEIPLTEYPGCRANEPCSFTVTDTYTSTQTFEFNIGAALAKRSSNDFSKDDVALEKREDDAVDALKPSFNLGASYSWSESKSVAKGLTVSRPTDTASQCGHFTFVPIFWTSCGTMTTSSLNHNYYGNTIPFCSTEDDDVKSTGNYCNTMPYLDVNGNQAGDVIYVLVDCVTNALLPKAQQDPIYQFPGVAAVPLP